MSEHKRRHLDCESSGGEQPQNWPYTRHPKPPTDYTGPGNRNISPAGDSRLNHRPAAMNPAPVGGPTDLDCGCSFRVPMDAEEEDWLINDT